MRLYNVVVTERGLCKVETSPRERDALADETATP